MVKFHIRDMNSLIFKNPYFIIDLVSRENIGIVKPVIKLDPVGNAKDLNNGQQ